MARKCELKALTVASHVVCRVAPDHLRAYCKYHGLNPDTVRLNELRRHIRRTLEDSAWTALDEQMQQGNQWLADGGPA